MKKRILSLALALALVVALIPAQYVSAMTADELETQVRNTYREACTRANTSSFNGYCAWLVNWQLVILGINSSYVSGNGKDEFDNYKNDTMSNGGYYITPYAAPDYTLLSALNAITNYGETDAYNVLVGFEKSTSAAGSRYGHVVFIHGIVDGMVYFCESFDNTIGTTTYPEGTVISCSIDTFAQYYSAWTTLDGVIHFEEQACNHAYHENGVCENCGKAYPWLLNRSVAGTYKVLKDFSPYKDRPYSVSAVDHCVITAETEVNVQGSISNAHGEIWYQFTYDYGKIGYIPEEYLVFSHVNYEEQEITCQITSPLEGALVPRAAYPVKGSITSRYPLRKVQAYIDDQLYATVSLGNQTSLNIQTSVINHNLSFSKLSPGPHTLTILASDIYREEMVIVCQRNFITEGEIPCEHRYNYIVLSAPTADVHGTLQGICDGCEQTEERTLPILNLADYTLSVIEEPSVEAEGLGIYTWNVTDYGEFSFEVVLNKLPDPSYVHLGDINGDGAVTVLDLMRLANFFAGKDVAVNEANADVNGDGSVTVLDLMRLANYFAGKAQLG